MITTKKETCDIRGERVQTKLVLKQMKNKKAKTKTKNFLKAIKFLTTIID